MPTLNPDPTRPRRWQRTGPNEANGENGQRYDGRKQATPCAPVSPRLLTERTLSRGTNGRRSGKTLTAEALDGPVGAG